MGGNIAATAELFGWTLMPWQAFSADVFGEYEWRDVMVRDDVTGERVEMSVPLLCYRTAVGTVPRQSGKTTLGLPTKVQRALSFPAFAPAPYGGPQNITYTAQDRSRAFKKFSREHIPRMERANALGGLWSKRMTTGSEGITFVNGSFYGIDSSTESAGHGDTLDLGFIDEAFALPDARLEQAMVPAMITRPNAQLHIWSTQGTDKAVWFKGKCDKGRDAVRDGVTTGLCYFEWSAPEGSQRLDDLSVWPTFHPACGYTQTPESLTAAALSMEDPLDAKRAFFNWHRSGDAFNTAIPMTAWHTAADPFSQIAERMVLAADINPSRTYGSVAVAGLRSDGDWHVEVIDHRADTQWMVGRIREIRERHSITSPVAIDPAGAAGSLIASLESAGVPVDKVTARGHSQACGMLFEMVTAKDGDGRPAPTVHHLGQPELTAALEGADKRELGDAWAWRRTEDGDDISPLVAATLALGSAVALPEAAAAAPVFAY